MPLPDCAPFGDCDFHKLSFEQKFNYLIEDDGTGCPRLKTASSGGGGGGGSTLPSLVISSLSSVSGNVPSGALAVTFTTSDDFVGTINGLARSAYTSYTFNPTPGYILPTIPYVITSGSINLDIIKPQ